MLHLRKSTHRHQLSFLLLVCVLAACGWGISRASANRAIQQTDAQPSLGTLLNPDGTLDLSRGFRGSLNPQGFRLDYAANGAPRFVPAAPTVGDSWDSQFINANGAQTFGYAVAVIGTDIYLGGALPTAGGASASGLARWNGGSWSNVGGGVNGTVYALAVSGTDLYVGGSFATVGGGTAASNIAKWNGSAWSALGAGLSGGGAYVLSLAVSGTDVYAGGRFTMAGGNPANNIARWNGAAWSAMGSGTDQQVVAVTVSGSNVYAGGEFSTAGGNPASFIARWNGAAWSAMGSGMDFFVHSLATNGSDVYAGGPFSTASGVAANGIARWNGAAWSALGSGLLNADALPPSVRSILIVGTKLYATGTIATAGGAPANGIAEWNGSAWSALGGGLVNGAFSNIENGLSLAASGTDIYAAGNFSKAGAGEANRIAKWNGSAWSPLGNTSNSVNRNVNVVAVNGTDVYVGGEFDFAGGVAAANIAKWNGVSWSAMGSGLNRPVLALAVSGADVYAGGHFTMAGGNPANQVARWNGSSWSAMGTGMDGPVTALAVIGTNIYAGGLFFTAGGNPANSIARWNGSVWSALGSGISPFFGDPVSALAVIGTDLYAGGSFTAAGGVPAANIAKWNGSAWSALGSGTNNPVRALAASGSDLYAGGEFTTAGGTTVNKVAKWNGAAWSALGTGVGGSGNVLALATTGTDVFAGGGFSTIGGTTAHRIAKWNGSSWSAAGTAPTGTNGAVHALGTQGTNLFAGGQFTSIGGTLSHFFGRFGCISSLTVNNTGDDPDATPGNGVCETATGNGVCTLRAAIQEANALAGCSALTINFSVTGIINTATVLSPIHPNLTINGPGANQLTVRGAGTHQLIRTSGTANVVLQISGLTLANGFASSGANAGAIEFSSSGGMLAVTDCALINNLGFPGAGQIYSNQSGGITISNTVISGNTVGRAIIVDRTPLSLTNTTISGNGSYGLQVFTGDAFSVTLLNCTIANNGQGGIQFSTITPGNTLVTLKNTIVANNSGAQIAGISPTVTLTSLGNNLLSDASLTPVAGDLLNANPLLASLGNYGGPTPTRALLPGSPAINAGTATGTPATDQRGVARAGNVDIGAFESRGFTMAIAGGNNQKAAVNTAFVNPLSVTVASAFGEPVDGGQITLTPPGSGASCNFINNPLTIASGAAGSPAAANNVFGGPYSVTAAANGANSVNFQLTNTGPVISSVVLLRTAGAGSSNSTVAQVSDPDQTANTLGVTVNGAASATVNGVTVSGLGISAGGVVTANVGAAVGASSTDFSLRVTNSQNTSATATLAVIVTPPACTPVWNSQTTVTATDGMQSDAFGTSVAVSGDTAVIGAYIARGTNNSLAGAAYVFTRNGAIWTQQQKLTPDDPTVTNLFGLSVAISGDTILVGAFGPAGLGGTNTGAGYVFIRNGATWTLQQKLTAPGGVTGDLFGGSVALKGDTAVIGADSSNTPGGSRAGAAYVFTRSGTTWTLQQKLTAGDGASSDNFGYSVAISGDTVVIGARNVNTAGGSDAGAAYVFTRSGTTWTLQQKLTASDGVSGDNFGDSVTISGDTVVIGASNADTAGGSDAGAAYVFTRSGAAWTQQQKLTPDDGGPEDSFGSAVSINADTVVIGALNADTAGGSDAGAAYIFTRSGTTWTQQPKLTASNGAEGDHLGNSVAVSGDTILPARMLGPHQWATRQAPLISSRGTVRLTSRPKQA